MLTGKLQYKAEVLVVLGSPNPRSGEAAWELEELLDLPLANRDAWNPMVRLALIQDLVEEGLVTETHRRGAYRMPTTQYELREP